MEIIVYSSGNCSFCKRQKEFLNEKGVQYTEKDIHESEEILQEFKDLGGYGTPFTIIKEDGVIKTKIMGFNRHQIMSEIINPTTALT